MPRLTRHQIMQEHEAEMKAAEILLKKLEWSGTMSGQPSSMGGRDGGEFPACPVCHGLKSPDDARKGGFSEKAVGHRPRCQLHAFLKSRRVQ